jgi:hypothetical protein
LEIVNGGQIGIGEFRVGCGGATAMGPFGCVNQSGGIVKLADNLLIGRYGTSDKNPNEGKGHYTISGGTLTYDATNRKGGLYIAGTDGSGPLEGTFTVVGNAAKTNFKKLSVTSNGATGNIGTVEFKIGQAGVSPIRVSDTISLDELGESTTTKLIISAIGEPPKADILLIENQSSNPISGTFDTVNGSPATEGANVALDFGGNTYNYKLTYKGGTGGNSIMLRYSPGATAPAAEKSAAPSPPAPPAPAAP